MISAPLLKACSSSSRTRIAAPSDRIIPFLLLSNGQQMGSKPSDPDKQPSLWKPIKVSSHNSSTPPARTTSALLSLIKSAAYETASRLAQNPVEIVVLKPLILKRIET